tara:strand:+ start:23668 stop:23922 length:255 start_codon:yes stop_codon:yes gene_type:complete
MKEKAITHLSQSVSHDYTKIGRRVELLEKKLEEVNTVLGYLAITNAELTTDMSEIYKVLKSLTEPDPYDYFIRGDDDPDENLPN